MTERMRKRRALALYGFPKSKKDNISDKELRVFKGKAKDNLSFTDEEISQLLKKETFIEIEQEEEDEIRK